MCLAVIALNAHAQFPLIILANRDEYHERPTATAQIWSSHSNVLAGRDLRAGGTWLGLSSNGKIGLLTNYREPGNQNPSAPSRGELVSHFLSQELNAEQYAQSVYPSAQEFNGFNLLLVDAQGVLYLTNRTQQRQIKLTQGVHGLSNATLDVAWPKVERTQNAVRQLLTEQSTPEIEALFAIFRDARPAEIHTLPHTGLDPERELKLSSPFILDEIYGTRCSTLIMVDRSGMTYFEERTFSAQGLITTQSKWHLNGQTQQFTALA